MSTPRRRRRQSAAVYRRRRLVVLLLAIAVIGGIVWLAVAQPWQGLFGGDAEPAAETTAPTSAPTTEPEEPVATADPTETPDPEPSASATPAACDPGVLEVVGIADQGEYAADQQPSFSIQLTNTGSVDCVLNVGTSTQSFVVTSGDDTWWQSTDCQTEPSDMEVTLTAGQSVTSAEPVVWDRTRSTVDSCDSDSRPAAPAGGASYHLQVAIAGVEAAETTQFLLY
ncbi:hypothetical protein N8K70_14090 [Microbacterium betulae]|uniref:DUF4232 domain-containing protein n=1 Tax=Microbacterium betulae TaxID=2981139 RepID=A0AA97FI74_9MICO|nr:hypothetical protein [Microbacterium sp. AB]WOF22509.1 hypothetical protein N8K70_14090 [Microbacterium sp. AB]